jgi:hypothetical protein
VEGVLEHGGHAGGAFDVEFPRWGRNIPERAQMDESLFASFSSEKEDSH